MSAFRRRTQFAAPLIVTVAACSGGSPKSDKPKRYPGHVWAVTMSPDACLATETDLGCPPDVTCNPPPPQEVQCPPGSSGRNTIRIAERGDKTCAVLPPSCVEESCLTTPTACPLPFGQSLPKKLGAIMEIEMRDGSCHVEEKNPDCPPNVDCNPPAPKKVACPPGITEEHEIDIALLADGTCAVIPEGCSTTECVGTKTECPK